MIDSPVGKAPSQSEIRDVLFGDQNFETWANHAGSGEPWLSFTEAKTALDRGDKQACVRFLGDIAAKKGLESRHYVQAWHFLRQLGVTPAHENSKDLYGVLVEVGLDQGLDIVVAYADLHSRYFNFSGSAVIWERPDDTLDPFVQNLLRAGQVAVNRIGPWGGPRPGPPPKGQVRINMLTPSGLHFGQGPFDLLAKDPLGGPVIAASVTLMKELMRKSHK